MGSEVRLPRLSELLALASCVALRIYIGFSCVCGYLWLGCLGELLNLAMNLQLIPNPKPKSLKPKP